MKLYLAGFFNRQADLLGMAEELQNSGFEVISRWLQERPGEALSYQDKRYTAQVDLEDIDNSDAMVFFSARSRDYREIPVQSLTRGGRHVEFGYALAKGKPIVIFGQQENVFHYLKGLYFATDVKDLVETLKGLVPVESI
jgi:nucleoside 2-deoxyribosyltransferase